MTIQRRPFSRTLLISVLALLLPLGLAAGRPSRVPAAATFHEKAKVWVLDADGKQTVWYKDGVLKARGDFRSGQREGNWQFWWETGKLKGEGAYRTNRKEGVWKFFYKTGQLKSTGQYVNNLREGTWLTYHRSGRKAAEGEYKNNYKEGLWTNYYESGQVFYKGNYRRDMAHGEWTYYFEGGKLHQKGQFRRDRRVGSWYICVFAAGPCQNQAFNNPGAPAFSGMPPAGKSSTAGGPRDTSDPMKLLNSMDSGGVPDKVPPGLQKSNGWD